MGSFFLACDVDGTLLQHTDQHISQQNIQAIRRFRSAGHMFALCTGRTETWTVPLLESNDLHCDALILSNGSDLYTVNPENYLDLTRIKSTMIPNHICQEIITYFYHKKQFAICWDDGSLTYEMADRLLNAETSIIQESKAQLVSFENFQHSDSACLTINIAPLNASVSLAKEVKQYIVNTWGAYIDVFRNQFFVDVAPKNSSKGTGLQNMLKHLNFQGEVYGIGDSYNDVPMFETLGFNNSFVMSNSESEMLVYGTQVTTVAECIDILMQK